MTTRSSTRPPDARVIQNAHGLEVVPRDVFKRVDEIFTIVNRAQVTVHVSFDLGTEPPSGDIEPGATGDFKILNTDPGVYDYRVQAELTDNRSRTSFPLRASGGSDPRIIIDF